MKQQQSGNAYGYFRRCHDFVGQKNPAGGCNQQEVQSLEDEQMMPPRSTGSCVVVHLETCHTTQQENY